ncbi:MAG: VTT domain-containing protein [Vicinamibacterales bacterium]|nr:VTT domain-containing protein [Vicinamibacterales bacterium]
MLTAAAATIRDWATELGGVGLFILGALDSSFLSFPQVNDIIIVYLSTKTPSLMTYYAGMSTAGSLLGATALYALGRRGDGTFLRQRFKADLVDRLLRLYARFGLLTLLVMAILPPPTPFKLLVLLAGTSGLAPWRFLLAVGLGRGVRYFGTGYLAVLYGEQALDLLQQYGTQAAIALAVSVLVAGVGIFIWRRTRHTGEGQL